MKLIFILIFIASFFACNNLNTKKEPNNGSIQKNDLDVNTILQKLYFQDRHNLFPLENSLIFTKEIITLNKKCDSITQLSKMQISKSKYPHDKPLLREGSRISSLYEGVTDFNISNIKTTGKKTEVIVTLSNNLYPDLEQWKEKIIFLEQNGLKIDNIYFELENQENANLKKSLLDFVKQLN